MVEKIKGNVENRWSRSVGESAHLVWLAGLGAFAKLGEEGGKLFEALVEEGEKIEKRTRATAENARAMAEKKTDEARDEAAAWDDVERLFEDRLARVLSRLGVPDRSDLAELNRRVDALQERIGELRRVREGRP